MNQLGNPSYIIKIDHKNLCLGCGLCESICGNSKVEMQLKKDGFYHPEVKSISKDKEHIIKNICPGVNVQNEQRFNDHDNIWGNVKSVYSGYSNNSEIRFKSSSGGIITAIASYILDKKVADAILHVGGDKLDYTKNSLRISKSTGELVNNASSRYAPALIFNTIIEILENTNDNFCFIGKPCDISALKNFVTIFPKYKSRFVFTISIICAGIPSYNATQKIIKKLQAREPVSDLRYRGMGWPGFFSFNDSNGEVYKLKYNETWGDVLGKYIHPRCKICPDGIGIQADLAVGDAWETKDGYPDFEEKEGKSLIITRTDKGDDIINKCMSAAEITISPLEKKLLNTIQPYQFQRRQIVGSRILGFQLAKMFKLRFKNLSIYKNLKNVPFKTIRQEFMGSFKRALNKRIVIDE